MKYSFYPTKDATIYSISGSMNTGLDEILEISKTRNSDINYFGRALLKWDWAAASQSLAALPSFEASASAAEYKLKLFTTKAQNIRYSYKIVSSNLTQDWDMGIGKANSTPITDEGVSWGFRTESGSDAWTLVGGTTGSAATDNVQSFEYDIAPWLIKNKKVKGVLFNSNFFDIGNPKSYFISKSNFQQIKSKLQI